MIPPASKRKRHSAFDDFPVEDITREVSAQRSAPMPPITRDQTTDNGSPEIERVERIERLKPSQMMPDRFQPRRLLPAVLREPFFRGEIDCYQAAERWLALSRQDAAYRTQVERLLAMGESFDEHGQIKPVTGSWITSDDGRYFFLIETGERRFWAACLSAASNRHGLVSIEEPLLRVEVVAKPSRHRQVLENRHSEQPSAVGQACEIASLILNEMGILAPNNGSKSLRDEFDYFRSARAQRMPAGLWEKIMPIMQLTRPRMVQLLNLLQLPTPLLEMADRYRLPERVLREILSLQPDQWERMLYLSIQNHLTSDEVYDASNSPQKSPENQHHASPFYPAKTKKPSSLIAVGGLRRFANTLYRLDDFNQAQALDEMADELVGAGDAENILFLLHELEALVEARLKRK